MRSKTRKLLWVDCETSGTNPEIHDIWSLAYLIEINEQIEYEGTMLIRPWNFDTIQEEALKVGGTTVEELEKIDYTISDAVRDLKNVWGRYVDKYDKLDKFVIGGFYVRFDVDFIRSMFKKAGDKYGIGSYAFTPLMDVSSFVGEYVLRSGMRFPNYKLGTVCDKLGIKLTPHIALDDIKATRELYYTLDAIKEVT